MGLLWGFLCVFIVDLWSLLNESFVSDFLDIHGEYMLALCKEVLRTFHKPKRSGI